MQGMSTPGATVRLAVLVARDASPEAPGERVSAGREKSAHHEHAPREHFRWLDSYHCIPARIRL